MGFLTIYRYRTGTYSKQTVPAPVRYGNWYGRITYPIVPIKGRSVLRIWIRIRMDPH